MKSIISLLVNDYTISCEKQPKMVVMEVLAVRGISEEYWEILSETEKQKAINIVKYRQQWLQFLKENAASINTIDRFYCLLNDRNRSLIEQKCLEKKQEIAQLIEQFSIR